MPTVGQIRLRCERAVCMPAMVQRASSAPVIERSSPRIGGTAMPPKKKITTMSSGVAERMIRWVVSRSKISTMRYSRAARNTMSMARGSSAGAFGSGIDEERQAQAVALARQFGLDASDASGRELEGDRALPLRPEPEAVGDAQRGRVDGGGAWLGRVDRGMIEKVRADLDLEQLARERTR